MYNQIYFQIQAHKLLSFKEILKKGKLKMNPVLIQKDMFYMVDKILVVYSMQGIVIITLL